MGTHHEEDTDVLDEGPALVDAYAGSLADDTLKLNCSVSVLLESPISRQIGVSLGKLDHRGNHSYDQSTPCTHYSYYGFLLQHERHSHYVIATKFSYLIRRTAIHRGKHHKAFQNTLLNLSQ